VAQPSIEVTELACVARRNEELRGVGIISEVIHSHRRGAGEGDSRRFHGGGRLCRRGGGSGDEGEGEQHLIGLLDLGPVLYTCAGAGATSLDKMNDF
jgi:hypothetical protein